MEDKDVGELWRALLAYRKVESRAAFQSDKFIALIRKLVKERQANHMDNAEYGFPDEKDSLTGALHDFGIDPTTWETK